MYVRYCGQLSPASRSICLIFKLEMNTQVMSFIGHRRLEIRSLSVSFRMLLTSHATKFYARNAMLFTALVTDRTGKAVSIRGNLLAPTLVKKSMPTEVVA